MLLCSIVIVFSGTPLTVKHLVTACKRVSDWHTLGIQLDLTTSQLNNIHVTYHAHGVDRIKTEMFNFWIKSSSNASWINLSRALRAIGDGNVASDIEAGRIPGNECMSKDLYVSQNLVTVWGLVPNQDSVGNMPPTSCWQQIRKNLVPILCSAWVIAIIGVLCVFLSTHCKYTISIVSTDQIL